MVTYPPEGHLINPKIRIIVTDDHPVFREGICRRLALEPDFEVAAQAEDGYQVLELLEEIHPDVLLLDLNMPRLDGLSTLQRLRPDRQDTKVIVLSASEDKNEFAQAMKFGACGIVLKQSPTEFLIKSIRKVHAGDNWLDSDATVTILRRFVFSDSTPLSQREREVVALVTQGLRNKEVAERLLISEQTVKNHLRNIFQKVGVTDRLELALYAIENNLCKARRIPT